ncbi:EamA family transporter [Nocardioides nitrophenolicus]|uniref:EamA family transporter n=1 Tax=Nocardioides nitrophenolicus TaxID=60489 RepID=UPI00195EC0D8|nr:EamA family transporter [Nocardioides nitrophenolicus]MBM7517169.1 drug/metabolite transporter (DMT)-like permease [Nocardioides nitrophenolicus]
MSRGPLALCLAAVWLLWGSVYLAIRLVVREVDPFQAMAQRYVVAGLILVAVAVLRGGWAALRVSRAEALGLVVTGVLLVSLGNGFQALAQVGGLPSGVAALIVATVPAWAVVLRLATGDRPPAATLCGVAVGFAGLVALVGLGQGAGGEVPLLAAACCLAGSLSFTVGSFLQGRMTMPTDIVTVAAYQQLVAACSSTVLAVAAGERVSVDYSGSGWFAMAWLVLACSVSAFLAFAWLLAHVPLSLTATHAYVNPVVAVLLGWLVLAEPLGAGVLVGGGAVVAAVVLIIASEQSARRRRAAPIPLGIDENLSK